MRQDHMLEDPENFEIPPCTLTGQINFVDFPAGSFHLNLAPPLRVAKCRETGMLYLCPRPSKKNREALLNGALPTALREYGESTYEYRAVDRLRSAGFERRVRELGRLISNPDKSVLDIGTSSGAFIKVALRCGWRAKGIEPLPDDARACQSEGLDVTQGRAERLPYEDSSFDVVHASHVFEHLEDPLAAAREAWRVLKPGGLLLIEVPNQLDSFGFHRDGWCRATRQRKRDVTSIHHLWFFGRRTLADLFRRAGFEDTKVTNVHHALLSGWRLPASLVSRCLSDWFWGAGLIRGVGTKRVRSDIR